MQAVNGDSQSVASDPITVTATSARPSMTEAEMAPLAAIVPNGNGSSNGNGNLAVSRIS